MSDSARVPVAGGCCKVGVYFSIVEGPEYEMQTEDGFDYHCDQFVVAHMPDEGKTKLYLGFAWRQQAVELIEAAEAYGSIDPAKWGREDPWADYHAESLQQRLGAFGTEWQIEENERRGK